MASYKEHVLKDIEDQVSAATPSYVRFCFPCCGGPIGTAETFPFLLPSDKKESIMSAIENYRRLRAEGGEDGGRSGGGCCSVAGLLDCCCWGSPIEDDAKIRSPPYCMPVIVFSLLFVVTCALLSYWMGPGALLICFIFIGMVAACLGQCFMHHTALLPVLVLTGALTVILAGFVGALNWTAFYHLYRTAQAGRSYTDVSALDKALPHSDAGTIVFKDATLNTMNSMGLSDGEHMYCVAPVMAPQQSSSEGSEALTVHFWAVGMDCCEKHQNFACDDAAVVNVNGGIVVPQPHLERWLGIYFDIFTTASQWDKYVEAVQAAAAFHGIRAGSAPVLLRWVEKPEEVKTVWRAAAVLILVLSGVVHLLLVAAAWMLIGFYYTRRLREQFGYGHDASQSRGVPADSAKIEQTSSSMRDPFLLGGVNPI